MTVFVCVCFNKATGTIESLAQVFKVRKGN